VAATAPVIDPILFGRLSGASTRSHTRPGQLRNRAMLEINALTVCSPSRASRSKIARRVRSASTLKIASGALCI